MNNGRWDNHWFRMARAAATNSLCMSRHIGAVIVKNGKYQISSGYNGPPAGIAPCSQRWVGKSGEVYRRYGADEEPEIGCLKRRMGYGSGTGAEWCRAAHAERNAVAMAARMGHATEGCTIHLTCGVPCRECAKAIINAGIVEIVLFEDTDYGEVGVSGRELLVEAGAILRTIHQEDKIV